MIPCIMETHTHTENHSRERVKGMGEGVMPSTAQESEMVKQRTQSSDFSECLLLCIKGLTNKITQRTMSLLVIQNVQMETTLKGV